MFRKRLTIALAILAAAAVVEGLLAVWALNVAERQVQRGRVASDIQLGFVELSATKQRLRTWVFQMQLEAGADPSQRQRLQGDMRSIWHRLQELSQRAVELDSSDATRFEHVQRRDTLTVLDESLDQLERAIDRAQPLEPGTNAREAWQALSRVFDVSHGRDLRSLITDSISRESAATARERAAADVTLSWMRTLWLAAAATLSLAALLLAFYFTRALRAPIDRLIIGAHALQRGDLTHRIAVHGTDEFAEVARSVNSMASELTNHREREAQARHQLEELVQARTGELQNALEALQEMDARRRQLFADISHELRTPTTAIRGEAEVTLRGKDSTVGYYKAALRRIVDASRQLGMVIDDLLTMTRSDTDSLALKREQIDLGVPLSEAIDQARAIARERNVDVQSDKVVEPFMAMGDALRLRQLFTILIDNAVRYSRQGGKVEVMVRRLTQLNDIQYCEVRVIDQGIGIPAQDLSQVFERNFRGENARKHRADGSGLGLSIGAALARAHGGEITLDSSVGVGTTVILSLPLTSSTAVLKGLAT